MATATQAGANHPGTLDVLFDPEMLNRCMDTAVVLMALGIIQPASWIGW
jgi:hypothetical protein